jgi:hypothetical protein
MKVETTSLVRSGAPRRRVLFSDETARALHGSDDRTRAGIWQGASEWAEWAAKLVYRRPVAGGSESMPQAGEIEVR